MAACKAFVFIGFSAIGQNPQRRESRLKRDHAERVVERSLFPATSPARSAPVPCPASVILHQARLPRLHHVSRGSPLPRAVLDRTTLSQRCPMQRSKPDNGMQRYQGNSPIFEQRGDSIAAISAPLLCGPVRALRENVIPDSRSIAGTPKNTVLPYALARTVRAPGLGIWRDRGQPPL